jgi:hypothetical protein
MLNVLRCGKVSWFRHIQAPTVRSAVMAIIVEDDNGCGLRAIIDEIGVRLRQNQGQRSGDFRTNVAGSKKTSMGRGSATAVGAYARRLLEFDR